jgi:drug/metabolite transporter (DMT)-like permease
MLIAALTVTGYFIFILKDIGYLNAFGLFDTNGLTSIQIQDVIPTVFTITVFTATFIAFLILVMIPVLSSVKRKSRRTRAIAGVFASMLGVTILLIPVFIQLYLQNRRLFVEQLLTLALFNILLLLVFPLIQKRRTKMDYQKSLFSLTRPLDEILGKFSKSPGIQNIVLGTMLFLLALILFANSIGYIDARTQNSFYITSIGSSNYVMVNKDNNQVILAQLEGKKVLPNYRIEYPDGSHPINFYIINSRLDFTEIRNRPTPGILGIFQ